MVLRRPASTDESGHEHAEGNADAEPYRDQSEDVRTAKPRKARVIETVQERRERHRQDEEGGKLCPFFARARFGFHDKQA